MKYRSFLVKGVEGATRPVYGVEREGKDLSIGCLIWTCLFDRLGFCAFVEGTVCRCFMAGGCLQSLIRNTTYYYSSLFIGINVVNISLKIYIL